MLKSVRFKEWLNKKGKIIVDSYCPFLAFFYATLSNSTIPIELHLSYYYYSQILSFFGSQFDENTLNSFAIGTIFTVRGFNHVFSAFRYFASSAISETHH